MIGVLSLNSELRTTVESLNQKCREISPGLLFSDAFVAKIPLSNISDEMAFWYAVTNLYGLFYDCAPYIFRSHNQFGRCQYAKEGDNTLPKTLLDILVENGCLTDNNRRKIKDYIFALKELRTCFCHNKPSSTFNRHEITRSFGFHPGNWEVFPYLSTSSSSFNYSDGLTVLHQKTSFIFSLLAAAISSLANITDDDIVDNIILDWSCAIVAWYMQSDDVINRCLRSYFSSHPQGSSKHHQVKEWKKQLTQIAKDCVSDGAAGVEYLLDWRDDLRDIAYASHTQATAELILSEFFDDVLT